MNKVTSRKWFFSCVVNACGYYDSLE